MSFQGQGAGGGQGRPGPSMNNPNPRKARKKKARQPAAPYLAVAPPSLGSPAPPEPSRGGLILPSDYVRSSPAPAFGGRSGHYAAGLLSPPTIRASPSPAPRGGHNVAARNRQYAANLVAPPSLMPGGRPGSPLSNRPPLHTNNSSGRSVPRLHELAIEGSAAQHPRPESPLSDNAPQPQRRRRRRRVIEASPTSPRQVTSHEEGRAMVRRSESVRRRNVWEDPQLDIEEAADPPPPFPFHSPSNARLPPRFENEQSPVQPIPSSPPPSFEVAIAQGASPRPPTPPTVDDEERPQLLRAGSTGSNPASSFNTAPGSPVTSDSSEEEEDERIDRRMWQADIDAGYSLEERVRREEARRAARALGLPVGELPHTTAEDTPSRAPSRQESVASLAHSHSHSRHGSAASRGTPTRATHARQASETRPDSRTRRASAEHSTRDERHETMEILGRSSQESARDSDWRDARSEVGSIRSVQSAQDLRALSSQDLRAVAAAHAAHSRHPSRESHRDSHSRQGSVHSRSHSHERGGSVHAGRRQTSHDHGHDHSRQNSQNSAQSIFASVETSPIGLDSAITPLAERIRTESPTPGPSTRRTESPTPKPKHKAKRREPRPADTHPDTQPAHPRPEPEAERPAPAQPQRTESTETDPGTKAAILAALEGETKLVRSMPKTAKVLGTKGEHTLFALEAEPGIVFQLVQSPTSPNGAGFATSQSRDDEEEDNDDEEPTSLAAFGEGRRSQRADKTLSVQAVKNEPIMRNLKYSKSVSALGRSTSPLPPAGSAPPIPPRPPADWVDPFASFSAASPPAPEPAQSPAQSPVQSPPQAKSALAQSPSPRSQPLAPAQSTSPAPAQPIRQDSTPQPVRQNSAPLPISEPSSATATPQVTSPPSSQGPTPQRSTNATPQAGRSRTAPAQRRKPRTSPSPTHAHAVKKRDSAPTLRPKAKNSISSASLPTIPSGHPFSPNAEPRDPEKWYDEDPEIESRRTLTSVTAPPPLFADPEPEPVRSPTPENKLEDVSAPGALFEEVPRRPSLGSRQGSLEPPAPLFSDQWSFLSRGSDPALHKEEPSRSYVSGSSQRANSKSPQPHAESRTESPDALHLAIDKQQGPEDSAVEDEPVRPDEVPSRSYAHRHSSGDMRPALSVAGNGGQRSASFTDKTEAGRAADLAAPEIKARKGMSPNREAAMKRRELLGEPSRLSLGPTDEVPENEARGGDAEPVKDEPSAATKAALEAPVDEMAKVEPAAVKESPKDEQPEAKPEIKLQPQPETKSETKPETKSKLDVKPEPSAKEDTPPTPPAKDRPMPPPITVPTKGKEKEGDSPVSPQIRHLLEENSALLNFLEGPRFPPSVDPKPQVIKQVTPEKPASKWPPVPAQSVFNARSDARSDVKPKQVGTYTIPPSSGYMGKPLIPDRTYESPPPVPAKDGRGDTSTRPQPMRKTTAGSDLIQLTPPITPQALPPRPQWQRVTSAEDLERPLGRTSVAERIRRNLDQARANIDESAPKAKSPEPVPPAAALRPSASQVSLNSVRSPPLRPSESKSSLHKVPETAPLRPSESQASLDRVRSPETAPLRPSESKSPLHKVPETAPLRPSESQGSLNRVRSPETAPLRPSESKSSLHKVQPDSKTSLDNTRSGSIASLDKGADATRADATSVASLRSPVESSGSRSSLRPDDRRTPNTPIDGIDLTPFPSPPTGPSGVAGSAAPERRPLSSESPAVERFRPNERPFSDNISVKAAPETPAERAIFASGNEAKPTPAPEVRSGFVPFRPRAPVTKPELQPSETKPAEAKEAEAPRSRIPPPIPPKRKSLDAKRLSQLSAASVSEPESPAQTPPPRRPAPPPPQPRRAPPPLPPRNRLSLSDEEPSLAALALAAGLAEDSLTPEAQARAVAEAQAEAAAEAESLQLAQALSRADASPTEVPSPARSPSSGFASLARTRSGKPRGPRGPRGAPPPVPQRPWKVPGSTTPVETPVHSRNVSIATQATTGAEGHSRNTSGTEGTHSRNVSAAANEGTHSRNVSAAAAAMFDPLAQPQSSAQAAHTAAQLQATPAGPTPQSRPTEPMHSRNTSSITAFSPEHSRNTSFASVERAGTPSRDLRRDVLRGSGDNLRLRPDSGSGSVSRSTSAAAVEGFDTTATPPSLAAHTQSASALPTQSTLEVPQTSSSTSNLPARAEHAERAERGDGGDGEDRQRYSDLTDVDIYVARLQGSGREFEGLTHVEAFLGPAIDPGASREALESLVESSVCIDSRRVNAAGKVKLKMSVLGARVSSCPVCMSQFRGGDSVLCLPNCGHVGHTSCVREWMKRSSVCMVCRARVGDD